MTVITNKELIMLNQNDIVRRPRPCLSLQSLRILEKKEFVSYTAYGKTHQYYPIISKDDYMKLKTNNLVTNFFGGSVEAMMSFFVKEKNIDINEIDDLLKNNSK